MSTSDLSRRTFLKTSVATGTAVGLAGVVTCASTSSAHARALKAEPVDGVVELSVADFEAEMKDNAAKLKIEGVEKVLVVRLEDGSYTTASLRCTHEGCSVNWQSSEKLYKCPCHNSAFGVDGKVSGGPATEPLKIYSTSEADGIIKIEVS